MALLRQRFQYFLFASLDYSTHLHLSLSRPLKFKFIHIPAEPSNNNILVNSICDSLRRGHNWDKLSKKFSSVEFNDSIVEKILLQLKEPIDAKRALGFFHWSAQIKSYQHSLWSYSVAIHILVRARMLTDARVLTESILKKHAESETGFLIVDSLLGSYKVLDSSPLVFDLLVQGYAKLRKFEFAFDVCCYLEEHGFNLSLISFNTLIHVIEKSDKCCLVWKIYEHMLQKRRYPNEETIKILISALCKEGKLQNYVNMLDRIHGKRCSSPSMIVNTSLLFRIIEEGRTEKGMVLLKRMLQKGMIIDIIAFSLIVYARLKLGNLESALEVFEEMLKRGFRANSFVYTSFIGAYCVEGKIEEANKLMQEMKNVDLKPYDETFNCLVKGFARVGRIEESLSYYEEMMAKGFLPSCSVFNEMIEKLCECGNARKFNEMLTVLLDKGFVPDGTTYSNLIAGYEKEGKIQEVLKLYYEMEYRSISPSAQVFESLIRSLCRNGKLEEAGKYLRVMKDRSSIPSVEIYETLVTSHFDKGDKRRALELYNEMLSVGLIPSSSCLDFVDAIMDNG